MSEIISIPIIELMEKTERWLLDHDYKKSTIGVYKATWNKFRVFSASPFYDRDTAKKFLFRYFGIDENAVVQKCDKRMQQARRHMDVLDEFLTYIRNFDLNSEPLTVPLFFNKKGEALSRYGITYILKKYVSKAELDGSARKISPHGLRHTKAMHLLRAGVNMIYIRDFLGHVDISTTEVYARIAAEMKRKVFEEKVPNFTPNTTMPWEEDKDLLQWLTQFGKKSF